MSVKNILIDQYIYNFRELKLLPVIYFNMIPIIIIKVFLLIKDCDTLYFQRNYFVILKMFTPSVLKKFSIGLCWLVNNFPSNFYLAFPFHLFYVTSIMYAPYAML